MLPFIDLAAQQQRIRRQLDAAMARVLDHGNYIMGPEVKQLEDAFCKHTNSKHCITVANGTDALMAALMAYGVGPGDAVITTPFTFFATVEAIMIVGATPVFADIDPATYNICPQQIELAIKQIRTDNKLNLKGIIPVDLFGLTADYQAINALAKKHGLFVLQDAAQAYGASDGKQKAPTHGHIGTTSFFPAKPLGCYGDGGAIFTDDDQLADLLESIRVHGKGVDKYDNVRVGQNSRLDTLQAAILIEKLKIYPAEVEARQHVARTYTQQLEQLNQELGNDVIDIPRVPAGWESVWAQFTVRLKNRDAVLASLKEQGIPSLVYYRTPAHLLGACRDLGHQVGDFPNSETAAAEVLSLPFHPYLTDEHISLVTDGLAAVLQPA